MRTLLLLSALLAGGSAGALAHAGATGIVKERMDAMEAMQVATKALVAMAKGEQPLQADEAARLAGQIATLSARVPDQFPTGSATGHSEALPAIWTSWNDFAAAAEDSAAKARAVAAAATGDRGTFAQAVASMAGTCKSCHDSFKRKD